MKSVEERGSAQLIDGPFSRVTWIPGFSSHMRLLSHLKQLLFSGCSQEFKVRSVGSSWFCPMWRPIAKYDGVVNGHNSQERLA